MKVSGLVPAYNEEENISEVVRRLKENNILPIVIDDGSRDKTFDIARENGAIVLRHEKNIGKGEAIKTGLQYVLKNHPEIEYLVLIDADMQYPPEESTKLIEPLEKDAADLVTGYRDWTTVPYRHRFGNFVWRTLFNLLFGTSFKDTNCGFVAMNKKAAEILKDKIYGGYILENSIFVHALKNKLRIKQVPVKVFYKKISKVSRGIRIVLGVSLFILREGLKHRFGRLFGRI
jgi:glycosyltransferase involved in cell wall biosynthesis